MAETGLSLVVSKEMLANLQKADNAITNLATKSEQAKSRIVSAFTDMGQKGVGAFINKLNEAQNKLSQLSGMKIRPLDFTNFTNGATNAIDAINKIVQANNKLSNKSGEKKSLPDALGDVKSWQILQQQILTTEEKIKHLKRSTDQYERIIKNINEGRGGAIQSGANKEYQQNKNAIQSLEKQIALWREKQQQIVNNNQAIQQQIRFMDSLREYTKSIDSLPNQRSKNTLREMRDFYQEEERQIQKNARLKEKEDARIRKEQEQNAKAAAKAEEQRIKNESNMRRRDYERYVSTQDTYSHAMNVSNRAKTLNQELRAIKALEQARGNLNKTDSQYEAKLLKLNAAIRQHKQNIDRATQGSNNLQSSHRGLMNISEQLQRRLALVFSVSQITGYVNKLISIRGEFELQQRALQAILQNRDEANKLWEKTVQLAVQSPFQVKELVTYTKQLAAYRVESDKLYDTTKMLADVSAGLGVDMQRLILAFGQVKAANYLRGTELRQFSEAGINILGELATYFTELEGISVSVGEVFERVSKRMVTFGDVEEVFKRLTSAGGTFYRMQEIQAETLRGQISNLKDSIDIMLNDVGKANEQTLKNSVALVRSFVESWERIVDILQAAGAAFIVVTAARIKDAIAIKAWSAANISATASAKGLNAILAKTIIGLRALWTALMSNPITAAIAGLTALGVVLYKVAKRNVEANKALQESANKLAMQRIESEKYTDILITLVKKENELVEANKSLSKESDQYKENVSKINKLEQDRKNILNSLESVDASYAKNLREIGADTEKLIEKTNLYNEELRVRIGLERDLQNISSKDFIKDYNTTIAELNTNAARVEISYANTIATVERLLNMPIGDGAKKALQDFLNSSEPYVDRVTKLYETLSYNFRGLMGNFDFKDVQAYIKSIEEVDEITQKVVDDISKTATTYKATPRGFSLISVITNAKATDKDRENAKNNIIATFEKILDDKAITGYLRTKAQETLSNIFNFKWEKTNATQPLEEWKVAYNEFIASLDQEKGAKIAPASLDTTLEQLRSDVDSQINALEKSIKAYKKADDKIKETLKSTFERDVITLANLKKQRDFLGYNPKETTDTHDDTWTNLLRVVKEVNTEFKNLNKTFDKNTALQGVMAKYSEALDTAFKNTGKSFKDFDFTSEFGMTNFYDWLKSIVPEIDKIKVELAKGEIVWDVKINTKELEDKKLYNEIERMFSGYEMSIELQKLDVPTNWARDFFNIDTFDLSEIRKKISDELSNIGNEDEAEKDRYNKLKEFEKKVTDMEAKEQRERLKTYLQYARDAIGERAKIKLEEMRKLQEIEKTFTEPEQQEVKQKAINKVKRDSEIATQKLDWEEFQKSDTFISLFSDLDNASSALINHSIDKLREFKDQWKDMPLEDMRSIVNKINELEIALANINPFSGDNLRKSLRDMEKNAKFGSEDAQELARQKEYQAAFEVERAFQEERALASEKEIADLESIIRLKEEGKDLDDISLNLSDNQLMLSKLSLETLNWMLKIEKEQNKNAQQGVTNSNNYLSTLTKQQKKQLAQAEAIGKANDMANDLYDAFKGLSEVLGGGDSVGAIFADMGMQMLNTVMNTLMLQIQLQAASVQAKIFGIEMNAAMGIIGWIVMAVQLLSQLLGAIFASHDKGLERQIEKMQKDIDILTKKLEKLEKAMDEAFNLSSLEHYTSQVEKNLNAQRAAYTKMAQLEQDKKKSDEGKVSDYLEKAEEAKEKLNELLQQAVSTATDGILDDTRNAARDFVDAWTDAFVETGDGLRGLKDNFQEIMLSMVQQQATMTIAGDFLDRWKKELDKYINKDDLELTTQEASEWVKAVKKELPMLNEALESYFTAMEQAGVDLKNTSDGLSGLQAGIKSITEEQAATIEAYLNSIRFFVAQNSTTLQQFINSFTNPDTPNPILSELRSQSEMIRAIRDMFSSVIGRGNSVHSGAYLKVVM